MYPQNSVLQYVCVDRVKAVWIPQVNHGIRSSEKYAYT